MGDMKILLLAVAIVGIIINTTESSASFTFLAESSKIHVETSVKGLRVSLKFTTAISLLNVKTNFNSLNTIVTSYKTLLYLQEGSTMRSKYIDALNPGINSLSSITNLYTQLFSFTDADKNIEPKSSCLLTFPMIDNSTFIEGTKFLQGKFLELVGPDTDVLMKADTTKMAALANFITSFNSICSDWHNQISNIIGELDTLDGLIFPESLKGKLEVASCLEGNGHEFEQITVLSTTPIKNGFIPRVLQNRKLYSDGN